MANQQPTQSLSVSDAAPVQAPRIRTLHRPFGRIMRKRDLDRIVAEGEDYGAIIERDKHAETVSVEAPSGALMLRALHKGGGIWLVMFSTLYYQAAGNEKKGGE